MTGRSNFPAQLGVVDEVVELLLRSVPTHEGEVGLVSGAVDALDGQAGAAEDVDALAQPIATQAPAGLLVAGYQGHGDVDAVDAYLGEEGQVLGPLEPVRADTGSNLHVDCPSFKGWWGAGCS